jgi:RpiR family transcriptional regulator, repressor of rpiB and als operon
MKVVPLSYAGKGAGCSRLVAQMPQGLSREQSACGAVSSPIERKMGKGNGEPLDAKAVWLRIRTLLPTLTALEARVASGLISQGAIDEKTLIKWVAEETGVSKAMIVKIAKKLGFNGFRSFRAELAEYNRLPIAEIHEELGRSQTSRAIVEQAIRAAIDALEVSLPVISGDAVEQAAVHLCAARQRDFYGVGGSAQIARDAAFKFLRIGIRASVFDDSHMMLMSAWLLQKGDVVVAFSHSGQASVVVEAVQQARKNGAKIVAVTNSPMSVLAEQSDVVLCANAVESPLTGENAAARIAQLIIVDALFVAVAQRNPAATEKNLSRTILAVRARRSPR